MQFITTKPLLTVLFCISFHCFSQSTVVSNGGDAKNSNGSISYSIGQSVIGSTNQNSAGSIHIGIQQPITISVILGLENKEIELAYSIYPNPTPSVLTLKYSGIYSDGIKYQLIDLQGKILKEGSVLNLENKIELDNFNPSTYILNVFESTKLIKSFKIIKN
jgi:hypothetical protein